MPETVVALTNVGLSMIVDRIRGVGTEPRYGHWGSGTSTADPSDVELQYPRDEESLSSGSSSKQTSIVSGDTYQVVVTLTVVDNPATITEFGLFDSSGKLFLRATFDEINIEVGDAVQFTVTVIGSIGTEVSQE